MPASNSLHLHQSPGVTSSGQLPLRLGRPHHQLSGAGCQTIMLRSNIQCIRYMEKMNANITIKHHLYNYVTNLFIAVYKVKIRVIK